mmetsp:Transcript_5479/g.8066  ORF Transcript_5479/g.8066 Transcript_5479/m.8066 type:complete len:485 (-) Transcript_5479:316-1770(-)
MVLHVALKLKGGGYTEEYMIREMLKSKEEVRNKISNRVLHWMNLEEAAACQSASSQSASSLGEKELPRSHYEMAQADAELEDDDGDDSILEAQQNGGRSSSMSMSITDLDDASIEMIDDITDAISWYRDHGVAQTISVRASQRRRRRRKKNNIIRLNCRYFLQNDEQQGGNAAADAPSVVVLTGWGESHVKYCNFMRRLFNAGFNVFTYDHRCQGLSARLRLDNPQVTDIYRFDDYVDDFLTVHSELIAPILLSKYTYNNSTCTDASSSSPAKISVVAHSMGCLIALKAQHRNRAIFDKVALVCPMFEPRTPYPSRVTLWLTRAISWVGRGKLGATGEKLRGPWLPQIGITHCHIRRSAWEVMRSMLPDIIVSTPSFRFLREILRNSLHFQRTMPKSVCNTPTLVLTAGKDSYVDSDATLRMVKKMRKKSSMSHWIQNHHYSDAYHDLLDEESGIARDHVVGSIVSFLSMPAPEQVPSADNRNL